MSVEEKFAIVTDGGSGIGKATTLALVREGYCVAVAGRRLEALEQTAAEAGKYRSQIVTIPADVSDACSVRDLFEKTKKTFGRLDLLFNNAGTNVAPVPLQDLSVEQWGQVIAVNLTGAFLCTQALFDG